MRRHVAQSVVMLFLISDFSGPFFAQESSIQAGIVQVTEGEVLLDGKPLQLKNGVHLMQTGQILSTKQGRAELILASNTNLSLGENASLRMEHDNPNGPGLTLKKGSILIEVLQNLADPIRMRVSNSTVEISKPGLYRLDSSPCDLRVYAGTALADNGSKRAQVKREREIRLDGDLSESKFDPEASDAFHQWSAQRSLDIFLANRANPETDNWKQTTLTNDPNHNLVGFFVNSNYRVHLKAQMPPKYTQRIRKIQSEQEKDLKAVQDGIDTAKREESNLLGQNEKPKTRPPLFTLPPLFKVQVDTVYVKVSVSDSMNRYVTGLEKEDFKVYEDNVLQQILYFSHESAPVSVAIVFDISRSMGFAGNIRIGKNWLVHFLQSSLEIRNPLDEYSLITFNTKIDLVKVFADDTGNVDYKIALQKPGGFTALYDAVYRGLDHLKQARNERKALIIISDGQENSSRYTFKEVRELSRESDVQIYGIGVSGPGRYQSYGHQSIWDLVGLSGGRAFSSRLSMEDIGYHFDLIHAELRNQYILGYVPGNRAHDGLWRQIKVRLDVPKGLPKLSVKARDGYYAPKL